MGFEMGGLVDEAGESYVQEEYSCRRHAWTDKHHPEMKENL